MPRACQSVAKRRQRPIVVWARPVWRRFAIVLRQESQSIDGTSSRQLVINKNKSAKSSGSVFHICKMRGVGQACRFQRVCQPREDGCLQIAPSGPNWEHWLAVRWISITTIVAILRPVEPRRPRRHLCGSPWRIHGHKSAWLAWRRRCQAGRAVAVTGHGDGHRSVRRHDYWEWLMCPRPLRSERLVVVRGCLRGENLSPCTYGPPIPLHSISSCNGECQTFYTLEQAEYACSADRKCRGICAEQRHSNVHTRAGVVWGCRFWVCGNCSFRCRTCFCFWNGCYVSCYSRFRGPTHRTIQLQELGTATQVDETHYQVS